MTPGKMTKTEPNCGREEIDKRRNPEIQAEAEEIK
jgi:hypothetical protein